MKNSVFAFALPAILIAGVLLSNPSAKNSGTNKTNYPVIYPINAGGPAAPDTLRPDPICNMKVDDTKGDTIHYKGHIFGFCSKSCRARFEKDPDSYLPKKKD